MAASLLLFVTVHAAQRQRVPASVDLGEVAVAVLDGHEKPATGLSAQDFVVKEDGAPVEIKTFMEARPTTPNDPDNIRSVVLLLDDVAVPAAGTQAMQIIAKAFLQRLMLTTGRGGQIAQPDGRSVWRSYGAGPHHDSGRLISVCRLQYGIGNIVASQMCHASSKATIIAAR